MSAVCDATQEMAVLGAILFGHSIPVLEADTGIRAEDFFAPGHRDIYEAAASLEAQGQRPTWNTVAHVMRTNGTLARVPDGDVYLACRLADMAARSDGVSAAARSITAYALARAIGRLGSDIVQGALNLAPENAPAFAEECAAKLAALVAVRSDQDDGAWSHDIMARMTRRILDGRPLPAVSTGWGKLDGIMQGGLVPGRLYVVMAERKSGKTSWVTQAMWAAVKAGVPVLALSMEMSADEIMARVVSQVTGISGDTLATNKLTSSDLQAFTNISTHVRKELKHGLRVEDDDGLSSVAMRARAIRWQAHPAVAAWRTGPVKGVLFVDYLQRAGTTLVKASREQEVAEVSHALKSLARKLDIAIVSLAQTNDMGQARHSRQIEQDADVLIHLRKREDAQMERPARPGSFVVSNASEHVPMLFDIKANRHGKSEAIPVTFHGPSTTFREDT